MKSKIVGEEDCNLEDCNLTAILPCHYTDRTFKTVMVGKSNPGVKHIVKHIVPGVLNREGQGTWWWKTRKVGLREPVL